MEIPPVQYLRTERGLIAYQRFGEGDRTIVWTGPPNVSIEIRWSRPGASHLWASMASMATVVIFDYRGLGSSDRLPPERVGALDEMSFDLRAVVEGLGTDPTVLVATSLGTIPAVAYAAEHARRLDRMILLNPAPYMPDRDSTEPDELVAGVLEDWGSGAVLARGAGLDVEPSQRWEAGRDERILGTPDVAAALFRAFFRHDVTPLLAAITSPTLVIHTGDVPAITPAQAEAVASAIPGASYLLRPSSFFNWGDWDRDIHEFITGARPSTTDARDLAAVVFTDIVDSSRTASERGDAAWRETLAGLDEFVSRVVTETRGRVVKQTGDGHLVEFARPGDALAAAGQLVDDARYLDVELRVGVHFGEIERRPDGDIGGIAVHLAARIAAEATAGEIFVSRTVYELTIGDGRTYTPRGTRALKGIPGEWELLALDRATEGRPPS